MEKHTESSTFDAFGRLAANVHADQTRTAFEYDGAGNLTGVQDENHPSPNTHYQYDSANRLTKVSQLLGTSEAVTRYDYDLHGNLTALTDPNGNVTRSWFSDFGELLRQESPVTGVTTYDYDLGGQLVSTRDANGATTTRAYDALGRPLAATSTRGGESETVSWTYDAGAFGIGRTASMSDPTGMTQYRYERRGLLAREEKTIRGTVHPTAFRYDANGNRSGITYPTGASVAFTFDYASRPFSATRGAAVLAASAKYLPFGPMTELVYGNGTRRSMAFDDRYRVRTNALIAPSGSLASYEYRHDAAGNITELHDALDARYNRDFSYDDLHRLTIANSGSALWGAGSYSYDAMGNMRSLSLGAGRNSTFGYEGITPKLTGVVEDGITRAIDYDPAGNEVLTGAEAFAYSPRNSLRSADDVSYAYDGRGVRTITSRTAPLPLIASVSIEPPAVTGGNETTATITLASAAPQGGVVVDLTSSHPSVSVPPFVLVAEGSTTANALLTTSAVASDVTSTITATLGASTMTASLNVAAPRLVALDLNPLQVTGGASAIGTVALDGAAPDGGLTVTLVSDAAHASVPGVVLVPAGATSSEFTVSTSTVASASNATITATLASVSRTATLAIGPASLTGLRFEPPSLHGGTSVSGIASLNGAAPASGALIALSSSAPELTLPSTVLVPAGAAEIGFTAAAAPVETRTDVVVTASYHGASETAIVTITPPDLLTFEVTPAMPVGGEEASARATIDAPAASGGASVAITSSEAILVPPATITVPAGAMEGTTALPTTAVAAPTTVVVSAARNGITRSSVVTLQPPPVTIAALTVAPASLVGSNTATGTLTLTHPAPASGLDVELVSSDPSHASVQAAVLVPAGSSEAAFPIATAVVTASTPVTITASHGVISKAAVLTLLPPPGNHVASLSIVPQFLSGGQTATGTVTLAAPSTTNGGSDVLLTSSDPSLVVPARVTVKKNQSNETFTVTSSVVTAPASVVVTASYGGVVQRTTVIVAPQNTVTIASFTITPARVGGGNPAAGTVALTAPAPFGGAVVTIAPQRRNMVSVPPTITIAEGATSTTFAIGTDPVHGRNDRAVTIEASYNGITRSATLTLAPPQNAANTSSASLCASATIAPCVTADAVRAAAATIAEHQYSLYLPELSLLAETQPTTGPAPAIAYEYVWFAGQPLAQVETATGAVHYYFNDHLGTPVIQTDASANIVWRAEYEPYGDVHAFRAGATKHQPLRFPGQENDGTSELSYNVFRHYRSAWGRYSQADPYLEPSAEEPNQYAYARENPTRYKDRFGLFAIQESCDCGPGLGQNIYKAVAKACSYTKKPACADLIKKLAPFGNPLDQCLAKRCSDDTKIQCEKGVTGACGSYSGVSGTIYLFKGHSLCPSAFKELGYAPTIFHEAIHSCGLSQEPYNEQPLSDAFNEIMKVCTGYKEK